MTQPHIYLSHGVVLAGTPTSKSEFERETGSKSFLKTEDAVFLKEVTIMGSSGAIAKASYFILSAAAIDGVGKSSIAMSATESVF